MMLCEPVILRAGGTDMMIDSVFSPLLWHVTYSFAVAGLLWRGCTPQLLFDVSLFFL